MLEIEEVPLDITIPNHEVEMVIMQPFVELTTDHEPYRWQAEKKNKQIERIVRTLEIAKQVKHGCEKTHFTIFPEYAIPGLEGVRKIQDILKNKSWNNGTIVAGGVDGLTKDDYSTLCNEDMTQVHEKNKADSVRDDQWVNCCVTWVKQQDGPLKKWIQPKLIPSWPERNITCNYMFPGSSVYVFKGKFENGVDYCFLFLICFDWIGQIDSSEGIWAVLSKLDTYWTDSGRKDINSIFVLQHNPEPNHYNFLENARNYFERRSLHPFVVKDQGVIVFTNTAGVHQPGKCLEYGYSSLICSPNASYDTNGCPPTFAVRTKKLRNTENLGRCKDALFREMGTCIHSFRFRPPSFINLGPSGRGLVIDEAIVHPIDEEIGDPRTPDKPVPASVKWINDQLDDIEPLFNYHTDHPLKYEIAEKHRGISNEIRKCSDNFLCKCIEWALYKYDKWIDMNEKNIHDVDNWNEKERQILKTIVHSLSIIKTCKPLEVEGPNAHATIKTGSNVFDVIIVFGKTHEECVEYATSNYHGSGQRFAIVVTRDTEDTPWNKKFNSILDVEIIDKEGPDIRDPNSGFYHCGYRNLFDSCFYSRDSEELKRKLTEAIGI